METLNVFYARSTWVLIFTVLANVLGLLNIGVDLVPEEAADVSVNIVTAIGAAWIYFERVTGRKKLVKPWDTVPTIPLSKAGIMR